MLYGAGGGQVSPPTDTEETDATVLSCEQAAVPLKKEKEKQEKVSVKIRDSAGTGEPVRAVAKGQWASFKAVGDPPGGTYSWTAGGNVSIAGGKTGETVVVQGNNGSGSLDDSTLAVVYTKGGTAKDSIKLTVVEAIIRNEAGTAAPPASLVKNARLKLKGVGKPAGGTYGWSVGSGPIKILGGSTAQVVEIQGTAMSGATGDCELLLNYTVRGVKHTARARLTVIAIAKIQYKVKGSWKDAPTPLGPLCPGSKAAFKAIAGPAGAAFPGGMPVWGGDAAGTGQEKTVTFGTSGARTVTAECGDQKKLDVKVAAANAAKAITWQHGETVDNAAPSSVTTERAFTATYDACANVETNKWHLRVKTITGGTDIAIHMGGYSTPQPGVNITTQAQGTAAINDMLAEGDATTDGAQTWVTEAAVRAHEQWHRDEWVEIGNHYWPTAETALERIEVDYDAHENNMANAVTAMRAGAAGADAKVTAFKAKCRQYWNSLADVAGSRPYLAGGRVLNALIQAIRVHGAAQRPAWVLPAGTNAAPAANHCYRPWLPYNP